MIEITNTKGGRKRYNEDIRCLQELALAFTEIFKVTDKNFVISGCQHHQEGYVWLNGKIRHVTSSDTDYDYIVCDDTDGATVPYHDNSEHVVCHNYNAKYSAKRVAPCIVKKDGDFPHLTTVLLGLYGILKEANNEQDINTPIYFNDIEVPSLSIDNNIILQSTDNGFELITSNGNFRFRIDKPIIEKFNDNEIIWQINGNSGNLKISKLTGETMSCDTCNAKSYIFNKKPIGETFAISNYPKDINNKRLIYDDGINTRDYQLVAVRQEKELVTLFGSIEAKYILGENPDDIISLNGLNKNKNGKVISYTDDSNGELVLLKSYLRLPDDIDAPNPKRLPGIMLMSDTPQGKLGYENDISGNAQLMIGADKHLYFLIKTGQRLLWRRIIGNMSQPGPIINFSFYID